MSLSQTTIKLIRDEAEPIFANHAIHNPAFQYFTEEGEQILHWEFTPPGREASCLTIRLGPHVTEENTDPRTVLSDLRDILRTAEQYMDYTEYGP